jgi:hypothetical protein
VEVQDTGTLTIFLRSVFFTTGFEEVTEVTTSTVDIELCSSTSSVAIESESSSFSLLEGVTAFSEAYIVELLALFSVGCSVSKKTDYTYGLAFI